MSARKILSKILKTLFAFSIIVGSAFFVSLQMAKAKEWKVFIDRIQTGGNASDEDFVEIRNDEDCALNLSNWKLRKRTSSGTESSVRVFDGERTVLPRGQTLLWANSKNDFSKNIRAHQESSTTLTDNNSLALFNANDELIDSLSWGTVSYPFRSDELNVKNPEKNKTIVRSSKTSSPSIEETALPEGNDFDTNTLDFCGVSKDRAESASVILSEILADSKEDEAEGEFIELKNENEQSVDLSGWILRDASKTGRYVFPEGSTLSAHSFIILTRAMFAFALNNTDETVTLFDSKGTRADSVSWKKSRENISLARDGARWRTTKFRTPGEANRFGNDPSTKTSVPKKGFAGIPIDFTARVTDLDRDETKVTWDFGDGRKSYKKDASHAFKKKGKYTVTLTATDGITDTIKTFRVEIRNYQAPKVRITSLTPNPRGVDMGNEYLLIENKSKKEINLKGWGIATKSKTKTKNFVNHKITKNLIMKPGETKKLTKKHAAFTLGNTRQHLELRDPKGETIQKLHYKREKSAPENAEFFKVPGEPWHWRNQPLLDTKIKGV